MKNYSAGNPYLPTWEYVPDGEPKLFDHRVYIYGSHDLAGGSRYCLGDYVCWSAPEDDLTNWRNEGVIYRKNQDPTNPDGSESLFAPDVVKGIDGHYYLYYGLGLSGRLAVAVSDAPSGPFEFYGEICREDGTCFREEFPYDPSVLVEDEDHIYLYYGFSFHFPLHKPGIVKSKGGMVIRLKPDMKTVIGEPQIVIPCEEDAADTEFAGHGFFEAPSIRKKEDVYFLVYCASRSNQLCYAVSREPMSGFSYGGVIVSNGDFEYHGNERATNFFGNIHGGMLQAKDQWYIFYHRHTHGTQFSRQGCAERIRIDERNRIQQVEMTSTGMLATYPDAKGVHEMARICNLNGPGRSAMEANFMKGIPENEPRLMQEENTMYLSNMRNGAECGYKYLNFSGEEKQIGIILRGDAGRIVVRLDDWDGQMIADVNFDETKEWTGFRAALLPQKGKHALYFAAETEEGKKIDIKDYEIL